MPYHIEVQHSNQLLSVRGADAVQSVHGRRWAFLDPNNHNVVDFQPGIFVLIVVDGDYSRCLEPMRLKQRAPIILAPIHRSRLQQQWRFVPVGDYHDALHEQRPPGHDGWFYVVSRVARKGTRPHWSMGVADERLDDGAPVWLWQVKKPNVLCPGNHWWKPLKAKE